MADNLVTESATLATLPDATRVAAVQATFSGDSAYAGIGVLAKSAGAEGSRVLTLVDPATEAGQDTGNASLASIDAKLPAAVSAMAVAAVASSATVVTLQGANAARVGLSIYNDSAAKLYVKLGAGADPTTFTIAMAPNSFYELPFPCYLGVVTGIWASATGQALLSEAS